MSNQKLEIRKKRLIAEAYDGTPETLKFFIDTYDCSGELVDDCGLLYTALLFGNVDIARYLLSPASQVVVNHGSCEDCVPLAVRLGDGSIVESLLQKGAAVDARGPPGERSTALHLAVRESRPDLCELLLSYGADVNMAECNGGTPLHTAAETGNMLIANLLLSSGASVYCTTATDSTPLHVAVKRNRADMVELLVKKGSWVNAKTIHKMTPLHLAADVGCTETVQFLVSHGAEVNAKTASAWLPLHFAVEKSRKEVVEVLLTNGSALEAGSNRSRTPLHIAVEKQEHVDIVEMLLRHGASVNIISYNCGTPLCVAVERGSKEMMQVLLAHGATGSSIDYSHMPLFKAVVSGKKDIVELLVSSGICVNDAQPFDFTPLWAAAGAGTKDIVEFLLDSGAHVKGQIGYDAPLSAASKKGRTEIAQLLLSRGACVNAETDAVTPLHLAVVSESRDMVELLLSHGADVNRGAPDHQTPLYIACKGNSRPILDLLLSLGASVNAESGEYGTPLHAAAAKGDPDIVNLLLSRGADVHAESQIRGTPLHAAAAKGSESVVKVFLSRGANVNAESGKYGTPLHAAALGDEYLEDILFWDKIDADCELQRYVINRESNRDVVDLLLRHGANVRTKSVGLGYPLQVAAATGRHEIVDLLLSHGADVDAANVDYGKDAAGEYRGTALCVAVRRQYSRVVNVLLKHNPNVASDGNREALSIALHDRSQQCDDIVDSLLRYGFSLKAEDARSPDVLRTALRNRRIKVVEQMCKSSFKENVIAASLLLPDAVGHGGLDILTTLTRLGVDLNKGDQRGMAALHYVAMFKRERERQGCTRQVMRQTVEWLLSTGADVDARTKAGRTPLYCAAEYGFADMIAVLVEHGADVNAVQDDGYSPLHQVLFSSQEIAESDIIETVELLLKEGADVNIKSKNGLSPLHHAAYCDTVLRQLLLNGADVNAVNDQGLTPLHLAAHHSSLLPWDSALYKNVLKSSKALLSRGANVNARAENGTTPLHLACRTGNVELVAVLIEHAARLPAVGSSPRSSPRGSPRYKRSASAERLSLFVNAADKEGKTPLHYAAEIMISSKYAISDPEFPHFSADIYQVNNMLLMRGALVNAATVRQFTPLHIAVESQDKRLVQLYLRYGADVNAKNADGDTPLHIACRHDKALFVETLLEGGADFTATNHARATPLKCAKVGELPIPADNSHIECTEAFLCLLKHIVKMKAAGRYVSERDLHYLKPEIAEQYHAWYYSSEPEFSTLESDCRSELSILKTEKVGSFAWSYDDILTADLPRLIIMARDANAVLTATSDVFKTKFPLYSKIILANLARGKARGDLLQKSSQILHFIYPRHYLPDICTDHISSYLSNADLRMFVRAYCPSD